MASPARRVVKIQPTSASVLAERFLGDLKRFSPTTANHHVRLDQLQLFKKQRGELSGAFEDLAAIGRLPARGLLQIDDRGAVKCLFVMLIGDAKFGPRAARGL